MVLVLYSRSTQYMCKVQIQRLPPLAKHNRHKGNIMFSLYVAIKIVRPESLIYFPDLESKQPIYLFVRLTGSVAHVLLFYIENEWLAKYPVGSYNIIHKYAYRYSALHSTPPIQIGSPSVVSLGESLMVRPLCWVEIKTRKGLFFADMSFFMAAFHLQFTCKMFFLCENFIFGKHLNFRVLSGAYSVWDK